MTKPVTLRERFGSDDDHPYGSEGKTRGGGGGTGPGQASPRGLQNAKKLSKTISKAPPSKAGGLLTKTGQFVAQHAKERLMSGAGHGEPDLIEKTGAGHMHDAPGGPDTEHVDPAHMLDQLKAMGFEPDTAAAQDVGVAQLALYAASGFDTIKPGDMASMVKAADAASQKFCQGKAFDVFEDGSLKCGVLNGGTQKKLADIVLKRLKNPEHPVVPPPPLKSGARSSDVTAPKSTPVDAKAPAPLRKDAKPVSRITESAQATLQQVDMQMQRTLVALHESTGFEAIVLQERVEELVAMRVELRSTH